MDHAKIKQLRRKARTDLYWLATEILGYTDFVERIHRPVCDLFVHKDRAKTLAEQDSIKQRLILDPRGHFKTTIDQCDIIQWLLNFPDIRILIMTGKQELAERMLHEVKYQFQSNPKLRQLFPEYAAPLKDFGTTQEFTVPCRVKKHLREPSVSISTVETVKAGSHYDVIKCDDVVNELNVGTAEQIEKTVRAFHYTTPLLEPFGYRDVIGTRYDHSDLYGWILDNDVASFRVHARRAGALDEQGRITEPILFPERFTVEQLRKWQRNDPYIFNCQYLNDPSPTEAKHFTDELLERHRIPHIHIPKVGRVFITWDLGFSQKQYADWSVGAVGLFDGSGRLFILDLAIGRFSPYQIVEQFFRLYTKWRPAGVGIEKAGGSELLEPALVNYAHDRRIPLRLDWLPISPNVRKTERIAGAEALLKEDKLYFSAAIPEDVWKQLKLQYVRFPKFKHDDIPDAISRLEHYRTAVDFTWPDSEVEMGYAPTYNFDGEDAILGAGIIG